MIILLGKIMLKKIYAYCKKCGGVWAVHGAAFLAMHVLPASHNSPPVTRLPQDPTVTRS